jgi:uncharacterized protein YkwD
MEENNMFKKMMMVVIMVVMMAMTSFADERTDAVVAKVNQIRVEHGLNALTNTDAALQGGADIRAKECSTLFSHTRPDGSAWYTANPDVMYGENLAMNYATADAVVDAWMASPAHAANILKPDYTEIAVSTYEVNGVVYWSQEFNY